MVSFWDKDKKEQKQSNSGKTVKTVSSEKKKSKKRKIKEASFFQATNIEKSILFPVISEDAMSKQALGQYVFQVNAKVNKSEIKKAVSSRYGVTVRRVNILNLPAKRSFFKGKAGMRKRVKKAIVTLEKGQSIEFFSNK